MHVVFVDLPFSSYEFTYDNSRELEDNVQCQLDRAFPTLMWRELFHESHLWHLDREWSDHAPIKLTLLRDKFETKFGSKPFRFEQLWVSEEECEGIIENACIGGSTLNMKMEMCAIDLLERNKNKFGKIFADLRKKRKQLIKLNS